MKRWIPHRDEVMRWRWLAPIAHHLEDDRLWRMERGSVARGLAIGLFFGVLIPFAQILFSVAVAIVMRGQIAVAAGATLVSNPLTFAPLYWLAHTIGQALLGGAVDEAAAAEVGARVEAAVTRQSWFASAWDTVTAAGAPLILGLLVLAVSAAVLGFAGVWLLWRPRRPRPAGSDRPAGQSEPS